MNLPSISFVIRKYEPLKNGKFIIRLRVIYQRKVRFYSINQEVTEEEWNKRWEIKKIRDYLGEVERKAQDIIKDLQPFTWDRFELKFRSKRGDNNNVYWHFEQYMELLDKKGKIGTHSTYKNALNSLKAFRPELTFDDITVDFLEEYEKWMLTPRKHGNHAKERANTLSTVGFYLRDLCRIVNNAIALGITTNYAFGKNGYIIPTGKNKKKALKHDELEILKAYIPVNDNERRALDYWFFCYYGNGMNIKDLVNLRREDRHGELFIINRAKTASRTRAGICFDYWAIQLKHCFNISPFTKVSSCTD